MNKPDIPKIEKPKLPIRPEEDDIIPGRERGNAGRGRKSLIGAGRLTSKAKGRKASLLGGS